MSESMYEKMLRKKDTIIETQQSQLRTLAEAVITTHSEDCQWCPYDMDAGACEDVRCVDGAGCQCPACQLAREIMGGGE